MFWGEKWMGRSALSTGQDHQSFPAVRPRISHMNGALRSKVGATRPPAWRMTRCMKRAVVLVFLLGCSKGALPEDHQIHRTDSADHTVIRGKAVDLSKVSLEAALMLPVSGTADIDIDVKAPAKAGVRDYSHATGHVILHCAGCRLGDDKATLQLPSGRASVLSAAPLYVGHIDFDRVDIEVAIEDGKARVKAFSVASKDVEISVAGDATLEKALADMRVDLCVRFKPTDELMKRDPKTHALVSTTGAAVAADGFFHIKLTDRVRSLRKLAMICDGSAPAPSTLPDPVAAPADPQISRIDPKLIAVGVKKIDDTHYEIDHTLIEKVVEDPMAFAKGARVVPGVRDGAPFGFKMFKIDPVGIFAAMGLRDGDVLVSFDGFDLSTADKALEAYTKLRELAKSGATFTLKLERSGSPLTVSYKVR